MVVHLKILIFQFQYSNFKDFQKLSEYTAAFVRQHVAASHEMNRIRMPLSWTHFCWTALYASRNK